MKSFLFRLITVVTCFGYNSIQAQTADEIINNSINAIGGKNVLSAIKSEYFEGTASAAGSDFPTSTTVLAGKGFKTMTSVNGSDIIESVTDTSGWMMNPLAGQNDPTPLAPDVVKQRQSSLSVGGDVYNYKEKGFTASLEGRETIQGVNAYKVKLSQPGFEVIYSIDPATWYILKTESKAGAAEAAVRTYSNYKKTDAGIVVPYTLQFTSMGYDVTINYTKVEINKDVDPSFFEMPK